MAPGSAITASLRAAACLCALLVGVACTPVVMPAGPIRAAPAISGEAFAMADGARLPYRAWLPEGPPRAVLLALHGFGDYSTNFFDIPAPLFTAEGVAVYAYDQRGFGAAPNRGLWAGSATLASDVAAVARLLQARHPGIPVFVLGESMGAAVALVAAASADPPPVRGYVLLAPGVRGRSTMSGFARGTLDLAARVIPGMGFGSSAPGFSPTNNDAAMERWARDPLTSRQFRVDFVYGLVNLMDDALAAVPRFDARALILYGARDRIVSAPAVRAMLRALREEGGHRLGYYPEGHHLLLRDTGRATVAADILAWIEAPGAPLPSGAEAAARAWLDGQAR